MGSHLKLWVATEIVRKALTMLDMMADVERDHVDRTVVAEMVPFVTIKNDAVLDGSGRVWGAFRFLSEK